MANTEVKIVESVDLKDCESFTSILEYARFIYSPIRLTNSGKEYY